MKELSLQFRGEVVDELYSIKDLLDGANGAVSFHELEKGIDKLEETETRVSALKRKLEAKKA